jgi:hypothetical protein
MGNKSSKNSLRTLSFLRRELKDPIKFGNYNYNYQQYRLSDDYINYTHWQKIIHRYK